MLMPLTCANSRFSGVYYRVALATSCLVVSCTSPDAATTDKRRPGDVFAPNVILEGSAKKEAVQGMLGPTGGYQGRPLEVAADGVRWSDVPMAIRNVADTQFIGVQAFETTADKIIASTVASDGNRGSVTVTRSATGSIRVEVQLGVFPELSRDDQFVRAFDSELLRLGAIARPQK